MRSLFVSTTLLVTSPAFAAGLADGPIPLSQVTARTEVRGTWNLVSEGCLNVKTGVLSSYQPVDQQEELQRLVVDAKEVQYLVMSAKNTCSEKVINRGDFEVSANSPTLKLSSTITVTGTTVVEGCIVSDGSTMRLPLELELYFSKGFLSTVLHSPLLKHKCPGSPGSVPVTFWESRESF